MNFFGIHICQDEVYAVLRCLPFAVVFMLLYFMVWFRHCVGIWRSRHTTHCTHKPHDGAHHPE